MIEHPLMLVWAAFGAFVHWLKLRYTGSVDSRIDHLVKELSHPHDWRPIASLVIFVGLGAILSVMMVSPATMPQALTAGMAWTTLLGGWSDRRKTGDAEGKKD